MKRIAHFEKVAYEEFARELKKFGFDEIKIKELYKNLKLPKRQTAGSAGYDFFAPFAFTLKPNETIKLPTGIRCLMEQNWFLAIFPRSSMGFKFRLQLDNTVGIIDADFANSDNGGHILAKITNCSNENKIVEVAEGQGFVQGIFMEYGITIDDDTTGERNGGIGSTDK